MCDFTHCLGAKRHWGHVRGSFRETLRKDSETDLLSMSNIPRECEGMKFFKVISTKMGRSLKCSHGSLLGYVECGEMYG